MFYFMKKWTLWYQKDSENSKDFLLLDNLLLKTGLRLLVDAD